MTGGRAGGRAGPAALVLVAVGLAVCPSARLPAQVSVHVAVGIRSSTPLAHDSIAVPLDLRPALAPAVLITVRDELRGAWSADATLDISAGGLRRHEGGTTYDAGSATAVALTVGLRRTLWRGVSLRAGLGGLAYAAKATGVFREGSGGFFPLGTAAISVAPGFGARWRLALETQYDVHRFITPAMRTQGFRDPRWVHRVALVVRAGWGRARSGPDEENP